MTTFKANRKFPNPVTVTDDPKSHTLALQQIIEALNVGQRRTKEINSSYVRVHELVDVGLVEIVGNQLKLTNAGAAAVAAGASALADLTDVDLTGLADGNTLVWDSATSTWVPGTAGGSFVPSDLYDASLSDLVDVGVYMPSDGDILTWNSALGIWEAGESTTTEPDNVAEFFDDFLYHAASEFYQNASTWRSLASSSNSFSNLAAEAGHPGIIRATHANLTNGSYTIWCLTNDQNSGTWNQWFVNGGNELIFEASLRVSALPSSADNISYRASFQNVNNATHLAGFILDWDGASARWYLGNAAGGTWETTLLTTNLPTANTWFKVRVVVTSTAVRYYVDDVLLATHTDAAKIPTAALTAYFTTARAAAGAATRTMDIDYCLIRQKFASGRPA